MEKSSIPPCYKYIVRNISTEDQRHIYTLNYYANMDKRKVVRQESDMLYILNKTPETCGEMFSIGGVKFDVAEYVKQVADLPGMKADSCAKYYRSVLGNDQRNNLCHLCRFSKSYCNNEYSEECRVFRYLVTSPDNFNKLASDITPDIFRSESDIAEGLVSPIPALVPLLKLAFQQLLDNQVGLFALNDIRERL